MTGSVLDGVLTHHFRHRSDASAAVRVAHLLQNLVQEEPPSLHPCDDLHAMLADQSMLDIADPLTSELRRRDLPADRLREVGRWLAEYGTRRNAVAAGILLLGLAGDERDRDLLLLLGSLEDLSLYATVALMRSQTDRDHAVFELAQRVAGWGRIHAVERLEGSNDPEIKAWLLRNGFRNGVMNEYLAHLAATTGDLHAALLAPDVDEALLDGAGDILDALCAVGGPAKDIRHYPDGPAVIDRYLTLVQHRSPTLTRIAVVLRIASFLNSDEAARLDWSGSTRQALRRNCHALAAQPQWQAVVEQALASPDLRTFRLAIWPARQLGIPIRHRIRARLRTDPYDGYLWQSMLNNCPPDEIDGLIMLAEDLLPLADLATGPSTDVGFGPSHAPDHILDVIVSHLDAHPGLGWTLLKTALQNRTIRNRNIAIRALQLWPRQLLPPDADDAVRHALNVEPDPKVKDAMKQLLHDWST